MILVQWLQSMGIGILVGIGIGYLTWKLPVHVAQYRAWRDRRLEHRAQHLRPREQVSVARIQGAYVPDAFVSNQEPEYYMGERVLNFLESLPARCVQRWQQFLEDTAPSNPIEAARRVS